MAKDHDDKHKDKPVAAEPPADQSEQPQPAPEDPPPGVPPYQD